MKSIKALSNTTIKFVQDNSPAILAGVGAVGVVATGVLTAKATFQAAEILREAKLNKIYSDLEPSTEPPSLTKTETFVLLWQTYALPVGVGALSVAAIIGSHRISSRRAAALTAALVISERNSDEYKEKVLEVIGKNKEDKIRTEIAKDKTSEITAETYVHNTGKGDVLFMDGYGGRVFTSSMEEVKAAQNHVNHQILQDDYASLNELYNWLGLPNTSHGNQVGWASHTGKILEMKFNTTMTDDGRPCIVMDFTTAPVGTYANACL